MKGKLCAISWKEKGGNESGLSHILTQLRRCSRKKSYEESLENYRERSGDRKEQCLPSSNFHITTTRSFFSVSWNITGSRLINLTIRSSYGQLERLLLDLFRKKLKLFQFNFFFFFSLSCLFLAYFIFYIVK